MTKKIATLVLSAFIMLTFSANAQKGESSLSVGPSIGIPLNFNDGYKTGFGAGLRGYYGLTKQGSVLANINFISYAAKFSGGDAATLTSIKLGYKSYLNSPKFFMYGDGGVVIKSGNTGKTGSDLGLGGGLGYSIPTGKSGYIDIIPSFNIVFQSAINRTWLDLHFAYRFNLTKK
jgi:hypothetical protein